MQALGSEEDGSKGRTVLTVEGGVIAKMGPIEKRMGPIG